VEQDIFCKIASGVVPTNRLFEDRDVLAFPDINPQASVHILIIPKKHYTSLNEMEEKDKGLLGHMLLVARRLAKEHGIAFSGYRVVVNCGPQGGQVVPHLHVHLLGGRQLQGELG
jgi:histidine triad (HIT) family protein